MSSSETTAGKDYKDTVNLPKTEFPMKGNLTQLEPRMLAWWEEQRIYERWMADNAAKPTFVLHDGPPYANGRLHAGHALNKILKDIVVKYRNMSGRLCDYVPGWDCHGLPIEQAAEKRLRDKKIDKRTLSRDEFLDACRKYALEFVDVQREEFKRMGVLGRWSEPYRTLDFSYEAQEIRELATFARAGALYRKKKPVYWCLTDATALAEAEVEYEDHTSPSVYVAFDAAEDLGKRWKALAGKKVSFAIWTTTPWTLPANLAICVHPKLEYVFYELGSAPNGGASAGGRVLVVAKDLLARVLAAIAPQELGAKQVDLKGETFDVASLAVPSRILAYAGGHELAGLSYRHAFYERTSPVIEGEHVTLEQGTGLVHTAPGHGQEDYEVGLANKLDVYNPVKNDGRYDDTVGARLAGMKVFEANPVVIDMLVERGALLNAKTDQVTHSYPHCWRCKHPIVFRATNQWFISLANHELRARALEQIDRAVEWIPSWGKQRIRGMLEGRPDWCISRQRTWGVPIPVALCDHCDGALVDGAAMEKVAAAVEKEGVGVWYRTPVAEFLPAGAKCPSCGKAELRRETDILDVWFDSACSFAAVALKRPNLGVPVDLYLEGSDQHRGWFHSALLVGVGTRGTSPYKACLTHGFVVDGDGRKMSKSMGNVVLPEQIIKQYGAEVMRLWVASSDYRDDVRLSDTILKGLSEGYRKIRNTLRYALSNLYDFEPGRDAVPAQKLLPLDAWALARTAELVARVRKAYETYEFHLVYHAVVEFCAMDLSALYFDILKDRLYTTKAQSPERRSAQTALWNIAVDLLRLLAPVMSFTCEEAWQVLPGKPAASVFLAGLPAADAKADPELMQKYERLMAVRGEVQKLLQGAQRDGLIGKSLEARLVICAKGPDEALFRKHAAELPQVFIVSQVDLVDAPTPRAQPCGGVHVELATARGTKCPRCWTFSERMGQGQDLCEKCAAALG